MFLRLSSKDYQEKKVILKIKGKWVKNAEETIAECACVTADKVCSLIPQREVLEVHIRVLYHF